MAQIPTPPPSRPGSEAPEVSQAHGKPAENPTALSELQKSFDELLEQYLHLLDKQQELQASFSKQLSSGFLALAHANYTSPPGRRYGADYYDERMKATRTISIKRDNPEQEPTAETDNTANSAPSTPPTQCKHRFQVEAVNRRPEKEETDEKQSKKPTNGPSNEPGTGAETQDETNKSTTEARANGNTPSNEKDDSAPVSDTDAPEQEEKPAKKFRSDDPINWYGILVPPSLRSAQKSFSAAVQTEVPELAGTIVEMRVLEQKILDMRSKLEA